MNWFLVGLILPLGTVLLSLLIGRYFISIGQLASLIALKLHHQPLGDYAVIDTIIFNVRLPRILSALIIGGALSLSGTVYQSTFRNPMVSPGILGVANGAGFGAAVGILFSMSYFGIQSMAFLFGLIAVGLTYLISAFKKEDGNSILTLVLAGMVISTIFSSFISLTKYIADPDDKLPAITFWLMGSLASITMKEVLITLIPVVAGSIPLFLMRWKLNILAFGDEEAKSMGVNTSLVRLLIIICSTVITAAAIAISGIVGWVGLIIPHICRMISGPNHNTLVPLSVAVGAVYLLIVDDVARTLASIEIPLGIITSLIGAPFFIYLMYQKRKSW